jgi:phage I-like protein
MLLVPAGKFEARDGRRFDAGSQADMEQIVARTRQYHQATDMVVDYDHQSVFGAKDGVGGRAAAAGWVKELQVRSDGIWGRVEWTASAKAAIEAKEYRYISPVIPSRKADGRIVLILNAALTNTPALDLEAAAASAFSAHEEGTDMEKILTALGLAQGTGEDAVLSAITALLSNSTAIAKATGLEDDAKPADVLAAVNSAFADRTRFAKAAGLKDDAASNDIVSAVEAAMKAAEPDPTKYAPLAVVTEIRDELKKLKEDGATGKAEEAVEAAMKAGQITPAQKDWALSYAKADLAAFNKFFDGAPTLTASQLRAPKRQGAADGELDDAQMAVCKALGLDPKKYAATLAEEAKQKDAR